MKSAQCFKCDFNVWIRATEEWRPRSSFNIYCVKFDNQHQSFLKKSDFFNIFSLYMYGEDNLTFILKVKGQPRIVIWTFFEGLRSLMLYTKFKGLPFLVVEKIFDKSFYHICALWPFWSTDKPFGQTFLPPVPCG